MGSPSGCTDGIAHCFTDSSLAEGNRYYPDEDAIVNVIRAYCIENNISEEDVKVDTETMHWHEDGKLKKSLDVQRVFNQHKL